MGKESDSLKNNLFFNVLYQSITMISPLIVTPKISRVFGLDYLGIKSYSFSIVYYFAIFGVLGLDMLGQRKIALVKDSFQERSKVFWTIYTTRFILVLISSCLYLAYCLLANLSYIERIVSLCWLIYLIREMINPIWFLQGIERYSLISILGIISQIGYIVCTVVFVREKTDLPLYIVFYTTIPLVISISFFPAVLKKTKWIKPETSEMRKSITESFVYFVPTIATAIYSMVDKTMLGFFDIKKISTGLYESAERLVKVALALSTASFTIIRTRMTYLFGKKDPVEYKRMCHIFTSVTMMLCWPIMFGIIGISKDFVPIFFGPGFEDVIGLSYVFALVVPCLTISGLLQAIYIFPYGLQKTMDIYYVIIVSINIAMNIVFISFWGTVGAIISSIFSEFLLAIFLIIRARKDVDVLWIFKCSIRYILASFVMLFVIKYISNHMNIGLIKKIICEFVFAFISFFLMAIVLRDSFIIHQCKSVICRIINKKKSSN